MTSIGAQPVEIAAGAGVALRGQCWPGSASWIVLLHDVGDDQDLDRWQSLVPALVNREWSVLAVDLRGHGASDGEWEPGRAAADLAVIATFVQSRHPTSVALVAAGQTAVAVLGSAGAIDADALVLLSPEMEEGMSTAALRGTGEAKLIICGGASLEQRRSAERLRNASIGWSAILNLPSSESGTALLDGTYGPHAREHITGFLAEQEFVTRHRPPQRAGR